MNEIRVLICDDNELVRRFVRALLEEAGGIQVVGEASGGGAALVEAERLQPDVILLDLAMPDRSGLDVLPDLRRVAPAARIIVLSGLAAENAAASALALGAVAYLEKGGGAKEIAALVRRVVDAPADDATPAE